jgi:hypothetical protein
MDDYPARRSASHRRPAAVPLPIDEDGLAIIQHRTPPVQADQSDIDLASSADA